MLSQNIIETLNQSYSGLTKSEKKIGNYVYSHQVEVQYMSITSLAEQCGVAEATVFRFCKSLGFQGYNELKLSLARSFAQDDSTNAEVTLYGKVSDDDSFASVCKKLYTTNVSALTQTLELLDERAVSLAVDYLVAAQRAYCMGQGGSLLLAMEAWGRFSTISPNFFCVQDSHHQTTVSALLKPGDAIVFFSYSGATRDMLDILPQAHEKGVKVILITRYEKCPAAAYADVILLCGSNEGPLQVGSIAAKMAQLLVVDVLFNELWHRNLEECVSNNDIVANATARKLL